MGNLIHLLLSLPRQAWWLIAILAGMSILGGGGKKPKRKIKKKSDDSGLSLVVIVGAALLFVGSGGAALKVPAVHHAVTHVFSASGSCGGLGSVTAGEINAAAQQIGISCKVVRAQINEESGGNPSSLSPVGAEGVAQFMPGTWSGDGCAGSPWNVSDAMRCYASDMKGRLNRQGGNLRNALADYNAGSGNLSAGYGYADTILAAS